MNILGIDYGSKRIGLARVDTEIGVVLPYGTIDHDKWKEELPKLIKEDAVDKIVIGLPVSLDGKENENSNRVKKFGSDISLMSGIQVEYLDERFSSKQADQMGGEAGRDEKAAMIILLSYLEIYS